MTRTVNLYPTPGGIAPSDRYAVTINGMASFTCLTTSPAEAEFTAGHTASCTSFDLQGPCEVRIRRLGRPVRVPPAGGDGYIVRKACEIAGN